jgi:hypothetical protein
MSNHCFKVETLSKAGETFLMKGTQNTKLTQKIKTLFTFNLKGTPI